MRTNEWLEQKFEKMLADSFSDLEIKNPIYVKFGRRSKRQLGSISVRQIKGEPERMSLITLTGYFRDEIVPEEIIEVTLAHELVHYLHGFNSDHEQEHEHPHKGSVVNKELRRRGFSQKLTFQRNWLKENWKTIVFNSI